MPKTSDARRAERRAGRRAERRAETINADWYVYALPGALCGGP
jgi:hypothetical protein